ncbi:MAG: DUF4855 domain-containing protein [Prevotellaceae bacterium]|jgi:hypothetical protein|nr:DUF4855 domain-containing protein [Prevotellaceae bacterium]
MNVKHVVLNFIVVGIIACSPNQEYPAENTTCTGEGCPVTDMVLIVGGSPYRELTGCTWNKEHFIPYVSYTDRTNKEHSLFDGFLFLEIVYHDYQNGGVHVYDFSTRSEKEPARKIHWKALADYYFQSGIAIDALDKCIAEAEQRLNTGKKRKVVVVIPEPITAGPNTIYPETPVDYWGEIDGVTLDFTNDSDRITACKWYIDYVRQRFTEGNFQHLELTGFYWVAELSLDTESIISDIADYLNQWKYSFNWIPYWKENKANPDYHEWKSLKFTYAYLQPNYFTNVPYSRLADACNVARQYDLDLEVEFDNKVLVNNGNRGNMLRDYMQAFRENNVLPTKRLSYYQDTDALYRLYLGTDEREIDLFHDFCAFVLDHQSQYRP